MKNVLCLVVPIGLIYFGIHEVLNGSSPIVLIPTTGFGLLIIALLVVALKTKRPK